MYHFLDFKNEFLEHYQAEQRRATFHMIKSKFGDAMNSGESIDMPDFSSPKMLYTSITPLGTTAFKSAKAKVHHQPSQEASLLSSSTPMVDYDQSRRGGCPLQSGL